MRGNVWSLVTILFVIVGTSGYARKEEVRFRKNNVTVREAFTQVESQTDYLISYPSTGIDLNRKVTLGQKSYSLDKLLENILFNSGYTTSVRGNHILIIPLPNHDLKPVNGEVKENRYAPVEIIAANPEFSLDIPGNTFPDPPACQTKPEEVRLTGRQTLFSPGWAVRMNLLYAVGTFTPNGGVEIGLSPRTTLLFTGSYNGWRKRKHPGNNKKLWHWMAGTEYRYWFGEHFNGHFVGAYGFYGQYNISGRKVPLILEKGSENYRYQGYGAGGGISYGYQFIIGKRWNLELNAGVGIGTLQYDKWDFSLCGEQIESGAKRTFIALAKWGITVSYRIK